MPDKGSQFTVKVAETDAELRAAQSLRYDVFVRELGGGGPMVDHVAGLERDRFDPFFDHMIAIDDGTGAVVGVYRLLQSDRAAEAGQFADEGFEAVICGPGDIAQAHRADEFIHKAQLDEGVAFMHRLIEKLSQ